MLSRTKNYKLINNLSKDFEQPVVYKRRWAMLGIFCLLSAINAYQWIQISIVSDKFVIVFNDSLAKTAHIRNSQLSLIAMTYMIIYVPMVLPATWFLSVYGIRKSLIVSTLFNMSGALVKSFAILPAPQHAARYWVVILGQVCCGLAQVFLLGIPPVLAATWFGSDQVSTATSLGVFGNQIGVGLGFLIPPLLFNTDLGSGGGLSTTLNQMRPAYDTAAQRKIQSHEQSFNWLFYSTAIFSLIVTLLIVFGFQEKPKTPPTLNRMVTFEESPTGYVESLRILFTDHKFVCLFFAYGISTGIYYEFSTLLNDILLPVFPGYEKTIGMTGFAMIISGIIGSIAMGILLDKTKKYRALNNAIYVITFVSMLCFTVLLPFRWIVVVFTAVCVLGFSMTGYLPIGFEYGVEMTHPVHEGFSTGFLNAISMFFGVVFTFTYAPIKLETSTFVANILICCALLLGLILKLIIKPDLKRLHSINCTQENRNDSKQPLLENAN